MAPRKIMFATIAAGGSHVSSAHAMAQAVQRHFPGDWDTPVCELMVDCGFGEWARRHGEAWRWQLQHPWSIVWGQRLINGLPRGTQWWWRRVLRAFAQAAAERVASEAPRLIVTNHPFLVTALTMAQREFGLATPALHFQTTTLDATSLWAVPDAERFFCGSPVARGELVELGVPGEKIDVVGYPVRQSFLRRIPKAQARAELGLREEFTCLVMLGGEGVGGRPQSLVAALRGLEFPTQVVVVTGRNRELAARLRGDWADDPLVRIEGFVDNVADFQLACDVFVGKTGPASTFETLAVGRPILAPARSGTSENRILDFVVARGLGHHVPAVGDLVEKIREYHADAAALERVSRRARRWNFPAMAERVARYITGYACTRAVDPTLLGPGIA